MGTVWQGWDERLNRRVAVKEVVIPEGLPPSEAEVLRTRYLREARAAARLKHPSVVGVYDVIPEAGRVWIIMEFIDARDLAAILETDGPMPAARAAALGLQLLDALDAAHDAGVLHRDVKPANVLICGDDRAVLTDFGVASVTGDVSLTRTGQLVGSPAYLAPERVTGGKIGPPTDLWSLGCTLYAAVEGTAPFARGEQFAIIAAITLEPPPRPAAAGLLTPVLYGLLEKEPAARWDSARTRRALEQVVAGRPVDRGSGWGVATNRSINRSAQQPNPRTDPDTPTTRLDSRTTVYVPRQGRPAPAAGTSARDVFAEQPTVRRDAVRPRETDKGFRWGPLTALLLLLIAAVLGGVLAMTFVDRSSGSPSDPPVSEAPSGRAPAVNAPVEPSAPSTPAERSASPSASPVPRRSGKPPVDAAPAVRTITNTALGYRFELPGTWNETCLSDNQTCRYNALKESSQSDPARVSSTNNIFVFVHNAGGRSAVTLAEEEDAARAADVQGFPNYARLRLEEAATGSQPDGSLLEFTYDNAPTGTRHVMIFRTVVDGVSYEVSLNALAATFSSGLPTFKRAIDTLETL